MTYIGEERAFGPSAQVRPLRRQKHDHIRLPAGRGVMQGQPAVRGTQLRDRWVLFGKLGCAFHVAPEGCLEDIGSGVRAWVRTGGRDFRLLLGVNGTGGQAGADEKTTSDRHGSTVLESGASGKSVTGSFYINWDLLMFHAFDWRC